MAPATRIRSRTIDDTVKLRAAAHAAAATHPRSPDSAPLTQRANEDLVSMSSFLRAAMRHRCEAKQRLRVGAGRTCSCLEGPCRAQINFDLHDQLYLISRKCVASKAPEPRCRQSIRRRRRPSTCSRCCRMPQHRPATAKTASKKLSLATTTGLKTPLRWRVLRDYFASRSTMCRGHSSAGCGSSEGVLLVRGAGWSRA